jgi:hypothetical protein
MICNYFTSRDQQLRGNNFYTLKTLIFTIHILCFIHNLETTTRKEITNQTIFIEFNINNAYHIGSK